MASGSQRKHRMIQANGARIHAVEEGEGPLVVMIHGFPESWYSWRHQLAALAQAGYKAVAIDQRGYGSSSKFRENSAYRIGPLVKDVLGVIDAYGVDKAFVVGHDWGAPVAWTFAWLHPDRCSGVAGVSVPFADRALICLPGNTWGEKRPREHHVELAGPGKLFYQDYFSEQAAVIEEIEQDLRGWLKGLIWTVGGEAVGAAVASLNGAVIDPVDAIRHGPLCMQKGAKMKDAFVYPDKMPTWMSDADLDYFAGEFERSGFGGPLAFYHNIDADWHDLEAQAGKPLTPPAVFIGGEFDVGTIWGAKAIEEAPRRIRDYRGTHMVKGSGHWIQQEYPEQTNQLLLNFLNDVRRGKK